MKKYKILLACLYADFGQDGKMLPDFSNSSWEYENLYKSWKQLEDEGVVELHTHWVDTQNNPAGFERLLSLAKEMDLIFHCGVNHGLGIPLPQARLIIEGGTPIVDFSPDTHARWAIPGENWILGRHQEGYITHWLTPAKHMLPQMEQAGMKVKWMPFGIPSWCDRLLDEDQIYDVGFVGQKHGIREQVISQLRGAGITVHTWGHFWSPHKDHHGRPDGQEMARIFNQTKINLNLRWTSRDPHWGQIKGRDFELFGCGAFMLASQHVECEDLYELYSPIADFAEYHYVDEMIQGIKHWLANPFSRHAVAYNAYHKREANLWTTRFKEFLKNWETWK